MKRYEYRVIPAPRKGEKAHGLKSTEERFAFALTQVMNKLGAEGWEYQRADALPCEERVGLTGSKTAFQNVMVFRRAVEETSCELVETTRTPQTFLAPALLMGTASDPRMAPALGAAVQPAGSAPALGPANPDLAAE